MRDVEWYCFKGANDVLATEIKQAWRLDERDLLEDELRSSSGTIACFPFRREEHVEEHRNEVTNKALHAVATYFSRRIANTCCEGPIDLGRKNSPFHPDKSICKSD